LHVLATFNTDRLQYELLRWWYSSPVLGLGLLLGFGTWCVGTGCQPLTQPSTWRTRSLFWWLPETGGQEL
jgi:hypothetical protein